MQLVWTPRAEASRHAAIEHIAQDKPHAALNQLDEIERQIDLLLQHPGIGRPGRRRGTRELVISRTPFILVYRFRPRAGRIEILRMLHGSQQYP